MLRIYNTITRKKQDFVPLVPGHVGMYVCGPTVYGPPHLGHAKSYICFDIVRRYLTFLGYKVKYVQNITDVGHLVGDGDEGEDKIAKEAKLEKLDPYEIAYKYECQYFEAMDKLNILRPSISARATGFIMEIIDAVKEVVDSGFGYVTKKGNVYFNVYKYSKYGQLSNRRLDTNMSGQRIKVATDKQNPEDFALWKAVDKNTLMKWPSPWGLGCPGWHIECSVLSRKFLGDRFDIHGGGIDNLFPHHECECAQGDILTGQVPMNFFMHNNLVTVNGTKMGKSLGNAMNLSALFERFGAQTVRYFISQFHYRSMIDFNEIALLNAEKQLGKIEEFVAEVKGVTTEERKPTGELDAEFNNCIEAMNDDFNTPVLVAEILKIIKLGAPYIEGGNKEKCGELLFVINRMLVDVLGLRFDSVKEEAPTDQKASQLAEERWNAKQNRDFKRADELREELLQLGYEVQDTKEGYTISKRTI